MVTADSLALAEPQLSKLCSLCGVMVKNPREHGLNVHSSSKDHQFKCDSCNFSHANKKALSAHKRIKHCSKAQRKCSACDYKTHSKYNLAEHVRMVHEGRRPFACSLCGQTFSKKSSADEHLKAIHQKV